MCHDLHLRHVPARASFNQTPSELGGVITATCGFRHSFKVETLPFFILDYSNASNDNVIHGSIAGASNIRSGVHNWTFIPHQSD